MPNRDKSLYYQTVQVAEDYLGPAGERFVRRHISTHLKIKPEQLDRKRLSQVEDWLTVTFALLTDDFEVVNSFKQDLVELSSGGRE